MCQDVLLGTNNLFTRTALTCTRASVRSVLWAMSSRVYIWIGCVLVFEMVFETMFEMMFVVMFVVIVVRMFEKMRFDMKMFDGGNFGREIIEKRDFD